MKSEIFILIIFAIFFFFFKVEAKEIETPEITFWLEKILYKLKEIFLNGYKIFWKEMKKTWDNLVFPVYDTIWKWIKKEIYFPIKKLFTKEIEKREGEIKREIPLATEQIKKDIYQVWRKIKSF
jgi:hypothetical protein